MNSKMLGLLAVVMIVAGLLASAALAWWHLDAHGTGAQMRATGTAESQQQWAVNPASLQQIEALAPQLGTLGRPERSFAGPVNPVLFGYRPEVLVQREQARAHESAQEQMWREQAIQNHRLSFAYVSGEHRYAVIDEQLYQEGQRVSGSGARIETITHNQVLLVGDGVSIWLDVGQTAALALGRPTAAASIRCALPVNEVMRVGSGPHDAIIAREALRHGLDPLLVKSVIWVESCFDPQAVSPVGAQGLMQLMPGTAAELGVYDAFEPEQNIRGGVAYLAQMLHRFDQQLDLALAAYNAGPGAVQRHGGIPPFHETRTYVQQVKRHYQQFRPEAFPEGGAFAER